MTDVVDGGASQREEGVKRVLAFHIVVNLGKDGYTHTLTVSLIDYISKMISYAYIGSHFQQ